MLKFVKSSWLRNNRFPSQIRQLNLQEFQSKGLMSNFGINIQRFRVANSEQEARDIVKEFRPREYVVKAQILAGGRGKGVFDNGLKGGVHVTRDAGAVPGLVGRMIGHRLATRQTAREGVLVNQVMVAEALDIARETYVAIVMDRAWTGGGIVVVSSPNGGVDIEEVAARNPASILQTRIDINRGITREQSAEIAAHLGFTDERHKRIVAEQLGALLELFLRHDCTQIEINPFGVTPDGDIVCFDAKLNFDDNASFRQREIFAMHDPVASETDPRETEATASGLSYIGLTGDIGCVVNGAGLAMATMDIVQLHGGRPANFLDLGGGVTEAQVRRAFHILAGDPQVKSIFINIFGGIVNCATVAQGLTAAYKELELRVPLIVRLEGTNVDAARDILAASGIPMQMSSDLDEAAKMAVRSITTT